MARIEGLYRYPVKGLSPERLARVTLAAGEPIPFDRAYAIENGSRDFSPEAPQYFPKVKYLMLMRDERLATLETAFEEDSQTLIVRRAGKQVAKGKLDTPLGRQIIEQFLAAYMKDNLRGAPCIVSAPGFSFSDVPAKVLSILNLASVADLKRVVGREVEPERFRANIWLSGLPAWAEKHWEPGSELRVGSTRLMVDQGIVRCAATNVNPTTAERDLNLPHTLERAFGGNLMGVYVRVAAGGAIAEGDAMTVP
ncbi:MAG: MOSC domain-containing protein [Alphaproteobacteria bacterium]|nr:MOSC domain-containing protein [Alphaproteobacteria bacterium]